MSESKPAPKTSSASRVGLLVGLLLLCVVGVLIFVKMRPSGGSGQERGAESVLSPAEVEAATVELAGLGEAFGQVMEHGGDLGPLLEQIDRYVREHPDTADGFTLRGQVLMYARRAEDALTALERSLELRPGQANVHQLAGTLAMNLQRYDEARHHYEQAQSIEPDNTGHAVFLANALYKLGEDGRATEVLLAALKRDSGLHSAYALLSDIYAGQNKPDLALGQIDRALDVLPESKAETRATYTVKKASILRRDNKPAESLALLNALPGEARVRPTVLRDTATSWAMLGKPELAAGLYERVLEVDPSSDFAAAEAARWWVKAGDGEAARRNLQALRRINPRHEAINELEQALRVSE